MDKQHDKWMRIFFVVIIGIFIALSTNLSGIVCADSIITGNSSINQNSVSYSLNPTELNLTNSYTIYYDNATVTTTIVNTTNSINYSCVLQITNNTLSSTYYYSNTTSDIASTILVNQQVGAIGDGYYVLTLNCTYNINTTNNTLVITPHYDSATNQIYNITTAMNSSAPSQYSLFTMKNIVVDTTAPYITINYPSGNAIHVNNTNGTNAGNNTAANSVMIPFNFTLSDLTPLNCSVGVNAQGLNIANASFLTDGYTLVTQSSLLVPINIPSASYGNASNDLAYNITCTDALGNTNTGIASFQILNNASTSNNSAQENIFFNLQTTKSSFNLGEIGYYSINANNNSNVTITICPIASGWVQCYATPTFVNYTFPVVQQALPYTNKTGSYIIQGVMHYKNYTLTANTTYTTANTITAAIAASQTTAGTGEILVFNATASSGIGSYTYTWTMDDGTVFNGPGAYKNYTSAGTFPVSLTVNDSQGNQYNTSISVTIKNYYTLTVTVFDRSTNSLINGATVTVDDNSAQTDSNGVANFRLIDDTYDIYVSKNSYGGYINQVDLNKDQTVYMNMSFVDTTPPNVILLTDNDSMFSKDSVSLKFKAEDQSTVSCSIYTASITDGWFTLQDSGSNLLSDTEYTFELTNLSLGSYRWRVECTDDRNNKGYSNEQTFVVSDSSTTSYLASTGKNSDDVNSALDNMDALSGEESTVADILNVKSDLNDLLQRINRMDKDINDLSYRRDLNDTGRQAAEKNITDTVEYLRYNTPVNLTISNSKTFVKYVKDPDLKTLVDEYVSINSMNVDKNAFLESIKLAQSRVIISTHVWNVRLYYLDGKTKDITLVNRDIQVSKSEDSMALDNSKTITFVEVIPKNISENISELNILNKDYTVLKDDPLIELPPTTRAINYYVEKTVNPDDFQQADTVLVDRNIQAVKSTTGFAILGIDSISNIQLDGQGVMIILIVVLLLFYFIMHFDVIEKFRNFGLGSGKKVSYIKVLINDALDYLEMEDYDKAALVYREIKLSYEDANAYVRKQVYDESYGLCNKLDLKYATHLLERIDSYISSQDRNAALLELEKLVGTYEKMDEQYKDQIGARFQEIYSKIKSLNK